MESIIIKFDIDKYRSGKYYVKTRGGKPVRILCTDRGSAFNIVALIDSNSTGFYNNNGERANFSADSEYNLVLGFDTELTGGDIVTDNDYTIVYRGTNDTGGILTDLVQNSQSVYRRSKVDNGYGYTIDYHKATKEEALKFLKITGTVKCEFEPFQKVLVRNCNDDKWVPDFFKEYIIKGEYPYGCMITGMYKQCISYEGNEDKL